MRTRRRTTIEELRLAIDCLPRATRVAMLGGIEAEEIIAGAYASGRGVCPMLAAHRRGGRTSLISFARAWDRFVLGSTRASRPRPATPRELSVLRSHLEASLLAEEVPDRALAAAIASHRELVGRRRARERPGDRGERPGDRRERPRPGDPHRAAELGSRPGWSWMRVVRRLEDYERALALAVREAEPPLLGVRDARRDSALLR